MGGCFETFYSLTQVCPRISQSVVKLGKSLLSISSAHCHASAMRMPKQPTTASDDWEKLVGERIRTLRGERELTLEQLASQTALTKGQLSRIENGKVSSPVSTLTRIAAALAVSPGDLFSKKPPESRAVLVKQGSGRIIAGRGSKLGHTYESLAFDLPYEKDFEPYLMTIREEKIDLKKNTFSHPGHEFIFMLEGEMTYRHGDESFHLTPGDSLFFEGQLPHGPARVGRLPVRFLSLISNKV